MKTERPSAEMPEVFFIDSNIGSSRFIYCYVGCNARGTLHSPISVDKFYFFASLDSK